MSNELSAAIRRTLGKVGAIPAGYARLGKGDGSGVILRAIEDRTCYYHEWNGAIPSYAPLAQELNLMSFNSAYLEGVRIRMGYPSYAPDTLHILGIENGEGLKALGGLLPHEQFSAMGLNINLSNIVPLRCGATTPASTSIIINAGMYYDPVTPANRILGTTTFDLASAISSLSSGTHCMAVIYLNKSTGIISNLVSSAVLGTDKSEFGGGTFSSLILYPHWQALSLIHLYFGQTAITETDFYRDIDPRLLFGSAISAPYVTVNGSGAPTNSELTAAFGSPSNTGKGFVGIFYRSGGVSYLVFSNGVSWYYSSGILAV